MPDQRLSSEHGGPRKVRLALRVIPDRAIISAGKAYRGNRELSSLLLVAISDIVRGFDVHEGEQLVDPSGFVRFNVGSRNSQLQG